MKKVIAHLLIVLMLVNTLSVPVCAETTDELFAGDEAVGGESAEAAAGDEAVPDAAGLPAGDETAENNGVPIDEGVSSEDPASDDMAGQLPSADEPAPGEAAEPAPAEPVTDLPSADGPADDSAVPVEEIIEDEAAPSPVNGADPIASGTCGENVAWSISEEGVLTIAPAEGTSGTLPSITSSSGAPWSANAASITSAVVEPGVRTAAGAAYMFRGLTNCVSIDARGLDTSAATSMAYMFYNCPKLVSVDTTGWDTGRVETMSYMFGASNGFSSMALKTITGIENWNTSSVKNMSNMFNARRYQTGYYYNCGALPSLDLSSWDVSKVTDMSYMFTGQISLILSGLENWRPVSVTSTANMFYGCYSLKSLDLSGWEVPKLTTAGSMFYDCWALSDLDISWTVSNAFSNVSSMFYKCYALTELDLSGWVTSGLTSLYQLFYQNYRLTSLNVTGWQTDKVSNMQEVFYGCSGLTSLDLTSWNTARVGYFDRMFSGCSKIEELDLSGFSTAAAYQMTDMFLNMNALRSVKLGSSWKFTGKNITNDNQKAYLPVPAGGVGYTRCWIRDDGEAGPYTSIALTDAYGPEMAGTWIWEEGDFDPYKVKYAVSLLGIGVTTDMNGDAMGLAFGPALGADYVNSYKAHTPSGKTERGWDHRCLHGDDWATIVYWNDVDPFVYEQCVEEGCTHSVDLDLPTTLGNPNFPAFYDGDGPSVLNYEIYDRQSPGRFQHLIWQPLYCGGAAGAGTSFGGWGASRIRAMLNGYDNLTMDELGHNVDTRSNSSTWTHYADPVSMNNVVVDSVTNYVGGNTLLAAFPPELKGAIGRTAVDYDKVVPAMGFYNTIEKATSYDRLWLLSTNEIWSPPPSDYDHPNEAEAVFPGLAARTSKVGYAVEITTGRTSGYATWLRTPLIKGTNGSGNVDSSVNVLTESGTPAGRGSCRGSLSTVYDIGVSPCFALGYSGPAQWKLYLDPGGGTLETTYYDNNTSGPEIELPTPVYKRYVFVEWNTKSDGSGESYEAGQVVTMRDNDMLRLYAIYVDGPPPTWQLYLDPGRGKLETTYYDSYESGPEVTLPLPKISGLYIIEWNTEADGSGMSYVPGQVLVMHENDVIHLYARYEARQYSNIDWQLTLNPQGGRVSRQKYYSYNSDPNIKLPVPEYAHHPFIEWNTKADGSGSSFAGGQTITMSNGMSMYLYAIYGEDDLKRNYRVLHYKQNESLNGYYLADIDNLSAPLGSSVTPPMRDYEGFIKPAPQLIVIPDNDETRVYYYYDRETCDVLRLFGSNRYSTSLAIATRLKEMNGGQPFGSIVLARGTEFPDALAGGYLATVKKAPIILIRDNKPISHKDNQMVAKWIKANLKSDGTIYVLGSTAAIPKSHVDLVKSGFKVKRLEGKNRFGTNAAILEQIGTKGINEIIVTTGRDFPDALCASALSKPLLILDTTKTKELSKEQKTYLGKLKNPTFYVVGPTSVIPSTFETQLKKYGTVKRIAKDKDPVKRSVMIAQELCKSPAAAALAVSSPYPDGLCGGVLANKIGAPLLLIKSGSEAQPASYVAGKSIKTGVVFGSSKAAVSDASVRKVFPGSFEIKILEYK